MALRQHRVTADQWQRLAAVRRADDLARAPARASIGAIEIELRSVKGAQSTTSAPNAHREAATG
jgi:hypothetical protein